MLRCGCGMMIECEIKNDQTVESIEHTRRKESQFVGIQKGERKKNEETSEWTEEIIQDLSRK